MRTVWCQHAALQRSANRARLHDVGHVKVGDFDAPRRGRLNGQRDVNGAVAVVGNGVVEGRHEGRRVFHVLADDAVVAGVNGGFVQEQEGLPIVAAVVSDVDAWPIWVSFLVLEREGRHAGRDGHVGGVQLDGVAERRPCRFGREADLLPVGRFVPVRPVVVRHVDGDRGPGRFIGHPGGPDLADLGPGWDGRRGP